MQEEEIPIRELLHLCLGSEDEEHWLQFVRRTQPLIANVIINTLRRWREPSPSLVDDLIQETYLKLFANDRKALRSIKNEYENTIFGYLKVVASNAARDHFRQPESKVNEVELVEPNLPLSPDGFDRIQFARMKDRIDQCLKTLAVETQERDIKIFWLYYEQGYSAREISELPDFDLTVKGVESSLQRSVRFLKESGLGPEGSSG